MSDPEGLDLAAFQAWYENERPGSTEGALSAEVIAGGRSNLTYRVSDDNGEWIVRRPPLGHVQATAHDMGREYRVMSALGDTDVPVPATYAHCEDPEVIGAPFYVMEAVAGTPYRTADELSAVGPANTNAIVRAMIDTLAALHDVTPDDVGLKDFGRPEGFLTRQVKRWSQQLAGSHNRDLAGADEIMAKLHEGAPTADAANPSGTIVHGDYRLDNLLVKDIEIRAVIDWEMSTLGDPLTDLALLVVYDGLPDLGGSVVTDASRAKGYPSTRESLQQYAEVSGRDLSELGFHLGLAHFKLAVICEGIHYRYLQGQTVGPGFDQMGAATEPLIAAGLKAMKES